MTFVIQDSNDENRNQNTGEHTPVMYPRSEADRAITNNNKGGASVDAGPGTVQYDVGPYPVVDEEAETEGSGTA